MFVKSFANDSVLMPIKDRTTILNLLHKFVNEHDDVSWKINCLFSDGLGNTINQINIISKETRRNIGTIIYQVESGIVQFCSFKQLKKPHSENIIDLLLDMINFSKGQKLT